MDTVTFKQTTNAILEVAEKEGLWKDVPIFGEFYKLAVASQSVSDHIFLNKLKLFIEELATVNGNDLSQIKNMLKFDGDEEIARKVLLVVHSLTDTGKAKYIAQAINFYTIKELTKHHFLRSVNMIESMYLADLETLGNGRYTIYGVTFDELEYHGLDGIIGTPLLKEIPVRPDDIGRTISEEDSYITKYEGTYFSNVFISVLMNETPYSELQKHRLVEQGLL